MLYVSDSKGHLKQFWSPTARAIRDYGQIPEMDKGISHMVIDSQNASLFMSSKDGRILEIRIEKYMHGMCSHYDLASMVNKQIKRESAKQIVIAPQNAPPKFLPPGPVSMGNLSPTKAIRRAGPNDLQFDQEIDHIPSNIFSGELNDRSDPRLSDEIIATSIDK